MTLKEIREQVLETKSPEWFSNIQVIFDFRTINTKVEKKGFASIYQYVDSQLNKWKKVEGELPGHLSNYKAIFSKIKTSLIHFISNYKEQQENQLNSYWRNNLHSLLQRIPNENVIPYEASETPFLIELNKSFPNYVNGAYDFLLANRIDPHQLADKNYFKGALMGFEFRNENPAFKKRIGLERRSLSEIKNSFEEYYGSAETHLNEFLKTSNDKVFENTSSIDSLLVEKKESFERWYEDVSSKEKEFNQACHSRVEELEKLYKEKLKLEAPAKYWNDRATKLRSEGNWWLIGLILTAVIALIALGTVLFFISDGTLKELFERTGSAIRWSIVFITFVSFLAYCLKTFSKLVFSSFHLVRDAEEREQLVYVYLALNKEKGIDPTERHLVMQSIFSRADSGLLKDESSPTMPGNIMDKFISSK